MLRSSVRMLCLALILVISTVMCPVSHASISYQDADAPVFYVNTYCMDVYDSPSTKARVAEVVPYAKDIKVVWEKKGWAKVYTVNRVLGYCKSEFLTRQNLNTLNMTVYCQQSAINVHRCPDANSDILGRLYRNDEIHLVAMTPLGDWFRVEKGNHCGYVQRPRMDFNKYAKGVPAWCAKNTMTVYYDYRLDTKLDTLYFGEQVTLLETRGEWAKIRSMSDFIGFAKTEDLTTTNPNDLNIPVYTQADGNFMFKTSTDLSGRVKVAKNAPMTLLAIDNNRFWARVQFEEDCYYIPFIFLDTKQRGPGEYKLITTTAGVNIREGTKKSSAIVATVPTGTQMWLVDAMDSRAKVTTLPDKYGKSYTGFVELQYLK
ncbi:MAG: hypothetical protein IJJ45_11085 [Clostridia bacterium]|nr:hypothetical protein [Clostridia bacterium]